MKVSIPFVTGEGLRPGLAERLSPRIIRLIADNPGPFTYTGTGTYIVAEGDHAVVIDPGPDDPAHLDSIVAAAPGPVTAILVTHTHRDHSGGVAGLKARTGARSYALDGHPNGPEAAAPALDEGADHGFRPDVRLTDGEEVVFGPLRFEAVHTPGHIANHLCFALLNEQALFTGDHVMGWATTVVAPPDGDMDDYMESLDRLLSRNDRIYYPTHGVPIVEPKPFVEAVKKHRQARDRAILAAILDEPRTPSEIVPIVYEGLNPALHVAAALNVTAHLQSAARRGLAKKHEDGRYGRLG